MTNTHPQLSIESALEAIRQGWPELRNEATDEPIFEARPAASTPGFFLAGNSFLPE